MIDIYQNKRWIMDFKDKGLEAWEDNAKFWDDYMGDESNFFHRDMVRPSVEKFLDLTHYLKVLLVC